MDAFSGGIPRVMLLGAYRHSSCFHRIFANMANPFTHASGCQQTGRALRYHTLLLIVHCCFPNNCPTICPNVLKFCVAAPYNPFQSLTHLGTRHIWRHQHRQESTCLLSRHHGPVCVPDAGQEGCQGGGSANASRLAAQQRVLHPPGAVQPLHVGWNKFPQGPEGVHATDCH